MLGKSKNGSHQSKADEYAVIGLGRFGTSVARTLVAAGHTVLGVDRDMALVQRHSHEITHTAQLDSTDEEALKEINIESYGTVIVAIGTNFEANLMTSVALKEIGVKNVICKATTLMQRDILLRVGVDRVVLPEYEAGERLAMNITSPSVVTQIELCPGTRVSEVKVPDSMIGLTLEEIDLRNKYELNVVAIQRGESVLVSPKKGSVLRKDDLMVVIGSGDAVQKLGSN
ncbi:MAG: TrkA family potassium uptake protein [Fimbriimonadaceae bacterium]|nr:TrkA family potassium uptake protein [Armatimonadota bacterium]